MHGKSPGKDGFTPEFYLEVFDLLGEDLIESFNAAFRTGRLSISQRRGIINLIPKEDAAQLELQNWRPISLLNVDYKIASKTIARRIESVLPSVIHPGQSGFVKDRCIGENISLISDVLEMTNIEKLSGTLSSVDFRKAFDTLEWS